MKKATAFLLSLSLAFGAVGSAHADWDHHREFRPPMPPGFGHYREHEHRDREYRRGSDWAGPAALLAITGLAVGAAAYSQYHPEPVYVAPPPPVRVQPASGSWYYCGSAGQYYPYVQYCPEGWQQVMPPR